MQPFAKKTTWLERNLAWGSLAAPFLTFAGRMTALSVLLITFVLDPLFQGPDLCPLHRYTGLPCPGCGVTRALVWTSHGGLREALGANPAVVILFPLLVVLAASVVVPGPTWSRWLERLSRFEPWPSRVLRVSMVAFVGFGLLRLGYFIWLAEPFP